VANNKQEALNQVLSANWSAEPRKIELSCPARHEHNRLQNTAEARRTACSETEFMTQHLPSEWKSAKKNIMKYANEGEGQPIYQRRQKATKRNECDET
jgi:hypothetical protein